MATAAALQCVRYMAPEPPPHVVNVRLKLREKDPTYMPPDPADVIKTVEDLRQLLGSRSEGWPWPLLQCLAEPAACWLETHAKDAPASYLAIHRDVLEGEQGEEFKNRAIALFKELEEFYINSCCGQHHHMLKLWLELAASRLPALAAAAWRRAPTSPGPLWQARHVLLHAHYYLF